MSPTEGAGVRIGGLRADAVPMKPLRSVRTAARPSSIAAHQHWCRQAAWSDNMAESLLARQSLKPAGNSQTARCGYLDRSPTKTVAAADNRRLLAESDQGSLQGIFWKGKLPPLQR